MLKEWEREMFQKRKIMGCPCKCPKRGLNLQPMHVPSQGFKPVTFDFEGWCLTNWALQVRAQGTNFKEADHLYPFLTEIIFYKFMLWASLPELRLSSFTSGPHPFSSNNTGLPHGLLTVYYSPFIHPTPLPGWFLQTTHGLVILLLTKC